jgi:uncharacterized coiled-coil DUF342 family protein
MDICEKLRWMADKHCNELTEAAEEIERLREELKSYSAAVESLDAEVAAQRRAANEHRNAAMEADLRTQAAVRSEHKQRTALQRITELARKEEIGKSDRLMFILECTKKALTPSL